MYVGQVPRAEIDFVTNGPAGVKYWQVSETTAHEQTLRRELSSFSVRDNCPLLLTLDDAREQSL